MTPPDSQLPLAGVRMSEVSVVREGRVTLATDWLAEETPVALVFNGISHAVMMATPADLQDFALGFAFTEGLLHERSELRGMEITHTGDGIEIHLEVSSACEWRLRERKRTLSGRTGCGLCGTDSLSMVWQALPALPELKVHQDAITCATQTLQSLQPRQMLTGATHAAALCRADGSFVLVREDVGRHNALDKLIGAAMSAGITMAGHFVALTSRASFEMVQKSARAGLGAVVAVSAPTAMAVDLAIQGNILLVGFVRAGKMVAYTFADRLVQSPQDSKSMWAPAGMGTEMLP